MLPTVVAKAANARENEHAPTLRDDHSHLPPLSPLQILNLCLVLLLASAARAVPAPSASPSSTKPTLGPTASPTVRLPSKDKPG